MSDEARIARLTELARKVWPDDREIAVEHYEKREVIVWGHDGESHARIDHPRAFDALEAALLVLAGEPPAWVEQLAAEWEASARRLRKGVEDTTDMTERMTYFFRADVWERCARELRERARRA